MCGLCDSTGRSSALPTRGGRDGFRFNSVVNSHDTIRGIMLLILEKLCYNIYDYCQSSRVQFCKERCFGTFSLFGLKVV